VSATDDFQVAFFAYFSLQPPWRACARLPPDHLFFKRRGTRQASMRENRRRTALTGGSFPLCLIIFLREAGRRSVESRIERVEVPRVKLLLPTSQCFAKALEMHDFSRPQKADRVYDVRILDQAQNIVIGGAGFHLRREILAEIRDRIARRLEFRRAERRAPGCLRPEATVAKFAAVQMEDGRQVSRNIEYYNLDVIISVGYRVKPLRGTQFRIWASGILKCPCCGKGMNQY